MAQYTNMTAGDFYTLMAKKKEEDIHILFERIHKAASKGKASLQEINMFGTPFSTGPLPMSVVLQLEEKGFSVYNGSVGWLITWYNSEDVGYTTPKSTTANANVDDEEKSTTIKDTILLLLELLSKLK